MDSANIMSILQGLQQTPPPGADQPDVQSPSVAQTNVMQAAAPQQTQAAQAPIPPAAIAQAATAASPPMPKPRRSLLDTIGKISDVLATVGGAHPLYQPTLDANTARVNAASDHDLATQKAQVDLATGKFDLGDKQNTSFGNVLAATNDADDLASLPQRAAAAGFTDPAHLAIINALVAKGDPDAAKSYAASLGADTSDASDTPKYGGQPIIARGPDGQLHAFQANITGGDSRDILPPGYTVADTYKPVNLGGTTDIIPTHSATPEKILPNTEKPGFSGGVPTKEKPGFSGGEPIKEKPGYSGGRPIAAPQAPVKPQSSGPDKFGAYKNAVSGFSTLDQDLATLAADPRLNGATGLIGGRANLTDSQRGIQGQIDALTGRGIPAAIAAIKAAGGAAPRSVAEIMGEVQGLLGPIKNRAQPTADYIQNINRARQILHQRMNDMGSEVVSQGFATHDKNGNIIPASPTVNPAGNANHDAMVAEARRRGLIP